MRREDARPLFFDPGRLLQQESGAFGTRAASWNGDAHAPVVPNPDDVAAGPARADELDEDSGSSRLSRRSE